MKAHERLKVWGKARELTLRVHQATGPAIQRRHPQLAADLRAATVAVPVAIAMGVAARDDVQFADSLDAALRSSRLAEQYANLAHGVGAITPKAYAVLEARLAEIQAMLVGLRRRVLSRCKDRGRAEARPRSGSSSSAVAARFTCGAAQRSPSAVCTTPAPPTSPQVATCLAPSE